MAESYTAGQLLVAVKPDARGAQQQVRREFASMPDPVVQIDAEIGKLKQAKAKAQAELDQLQAKKADPSIGLNIQALEAKLAQANVKLDALKAKESSPKVDADIMAAEAKVAKISSDLERLQAKQADPKVDLQIADAEARIAGMTAKLDQLSAKRAEVRATADTGDATGKIGALDVLMGRVDGRSMRVSANADVGGAMAQLAAFMALADSINGKNPVVRVAADTAGAIAGLAMVATKAFALGGAVGAIAALGAAVLAIGPAGAVAAGGLAAAVLGFGGVGKALTALSAQDDASAQTAQQSAKQQQSAAFSIANAKSSLAQASQHADQARSDSARNVAKAEQDSARSIASAQQQVSSAQRSLASATQAAATARADAARSVQRAEQQAAESIASAERSAQSSHRQLASATASLRREQDALSDAWEQGQRSLQDLQDQLDMGVIDQRQAALDLADAKADLAKAQASGDTTAIAKAQVAYDRQVETIDELNKRVSRLKTDNAAANNADWPKEYGDQLDRVRSAQDQVNDASQSSALADAALAKARVDGAASVADAQRNAAASVASANERVQSAQIALAQAQDGLSQARVDGAARVTEAQQQGARSIAEADQGVVNAQRALIQAMSQTGDAGQSAADKVAAAFANLSPAAAAFAMYLWSLKPALDSLRATAAAGLFPPLQAGLQVLMTQFPIIQAVVGQFAAATGAALGFVLAQLASPFWMGFFQALGNVAGPIMMQLAVMIMSAAQAVAQLVLALLPFTSQAIGIVGIIGQLVSAWTPFIAQMVGALLPVAGQVLQALFPLGPVLAALGPILAILASAFASVLGPVLQVLAPLLVALTPLIQQLAMAFAQNLLTALQVATPLLFAFANWASRNPGLAVGVITAVTGIVGAFGPLTTILGLLAKMLLFNQLRTMAMSAGLARGGAAAAEAGSKVGLLGRMFSFLTGPVGIVIGIFGVLFATNEQFRGAVLGLLGVLGGLVAQIVSSLAPAFQVVGQIMSIFSGVVGGLVSGLATALVPIVQALAAVLQWLTPIIVPLVDIFLAVRTAMMLWAAAQWALNIAMSANPIGLIVLAVLALVGAVVWAYQNVGWFRDAVNACWAGIQVAFSAIGAAAVWLWQTIFVPAWNAIAGAVTWAWVNVLSPVVSAIGTGLAYLGAIIFTILVAPFIIAWNIISAIVGWAVESVLLPLWYGAVVPALNFLGSVFSWLWANVVVPVWNGIVAAVMFAWGILQAIWYGAIVPALQFLGAIFTWLYVNVVLPNWNFIVMIVQWAWSILQAIWYGAIVPGLQFLGSIFTWLYQNVVLPIWTALGATIRWVYDNVIKPAFDAVWGSLQWLGARFQDAVNSIMRIWDTVRGILARPINFMINTVWNNGILRAWNMVAGLVGIPPVAPLAPIPEFREGGMLAGPGTGTSDSILGVNAAGVPTARVSTGEFVVKEQVTRKAAPFLAALNAGDGEALQAAGATRAGSAGTFHGRSGIGLNVPGYAMGGPIEERINAAKAWLSGPARGIPYVWGGGSMSGMDCSGMQAAVTHILSGRAPTSGRIGTTASMPWGGFVGGINGQYAVGNKPSDHMAGTLAGQNVEQHGPSGTPFSFPSRWGADNGYFPQKFHLGEAGGNFVSGGNGGGGGFFNWILDKARHAFDDLTNPAIDGIKRLMGDPPPAWRSVPPGMATKLRDTARDFVFGKAEAAGGGDGMDVSGISGPVVDQVRQVAQRYGWDQGPQWDAIAQIVQAESHWDPNAANPSSSARGLFQKMTSVNGPVEPTPAGQAAWGLNYMKGRYGDPLGALAFRRSHGWYDSGGLGVGRGIMFKDVIEPERVLDPQETRDYDTLGPLVREMEAGRLPSSAASLTTAQLDAMTSSSTSAGSSSGAATAVFYDTDGVLIGTIRGEVDSGMAELAGALNDGSP